MTKLTIIGAGSAVFTKNIVADLLSLDAFKNIEIALQDIDPKRLKASHDLLNVVAQKLNAKPKITSYTNRRESLAGSDFVQTTIQVGGYKPSTVIDFEIPKKIWYAANYWRYFRYWWHYERLKNNTCFIRYC